jgi:hypothetical protein
MDDRHLSNIRETLRKNTCPQIKIIIQQIKNIPLKICKSIMKKKLMDPL